MLRIDGLTLATGEGDGERVLLDGLDLRLMPHEILGIVGETGAGKSLLARAIIDLLPPGVRHERGEVLVEGRVVSQMTPGERRALRGGMVSLIGTNAKALLDPVERVGAQLVRVLRSHRRLSRQAAWAQAVQLLADVGIVNPEERAKAYPHELSGGMAQRVVIAMALIAEPKVVLADDATLGLDATVSVQVLDMLVERSRRMGCSVVLITHDLGIVARVAHKVAVMYAGKVVENAATAELFASPRHPYTQGLLRCVPVPGKIKRDEPLGSIPGTVPRVGPDFEGCAFRERCSFADATCTQDIPRHQAGTTHDFLCRLPS